MVSLSHNALLILILSSSYVILAFGTLYYAYVATMADPTDPTI